MPTPQRKQARHPRCLGVHSLCHLVMGPKIPSGSLLSSTAPNSQSYPSTQISPTCTWWGARWIKVSRLCLARCKQAHQSPVLVAASILWKRGESQPGGLLSMSTAVCFWSHVCLSVSSPGLCSLSRSLSPISSVPLSNLSPSLSFSQTGGIMLLILTHQPLHSRGL